MKTTRSLTRRGPAVFVSVVATVAATLSVQPAVHAESSTPAAAPHQPAGTRQSPLLTLDGVAPGPKTVTLVTGDKVTLTDLGGGHYDIKTTPAARPDGSLPSFQGHAGPDGFYVYPADVLPAVESGQLDRELFDVKYLAENGYTDADTPTVPVIVQYPSARPTVAAAKAADALPGSRPTVTLGSIHASAVAVTKSQADAFWKALRGPKSPAPGRAAPLAGGVQKVWLDRKVEVNLDQSVPLIGAPEAWAAGYDGTGVKVAVLDTGIDENHPDLAGKVDQARSFVPGVDSPHDGHGHGTHVASTITGSGAASGGRYKGVAPGVTLEIGKVLTDGGSGEESWIIAGMQWAATSGAKVVSMSLGRCCTDGTDPMSQAVDDLTAQTGTLFVIAAGNSGQSGSGTIGTPGAADAALTVAATDKSDQLAYFSSRGPRLDSALKPDIAAPGVHIVAARAAGTSLGTGSLPGDGPVDDFYTSASGTSMATPHVAAAAAILAQEHPDWTAPQLKAALMSTSKDDGYTVYEQGAGRLDVARAASQKVFALTANVDYGSVPADAAPLTRQLTYTNLGDTAVTLGITTALVSTDGTATADGTLTTADTTLTVPAGGTASTTVTLDPAHLSPETTYTGSVVASDQSSGTQVRTPVGAVREAPRFNLTIHTLGRDGSPTDAMLTDVLDVTRGRAISTNVQYLQPGVLRYRVPEGTYSVGQFVAWLDLTYRANRGYLVNPEVTVSGDTDVTLDGRELTPLTYTTPLPAENSPQGGNRSFFVHRDAADGSIWADFGMGATYVKYYFTPTRPVTVGAFMLNAGDVYAAPEVTMRVEGGTGPELHPMVFPHQGTRPNGGLMTDQIPFTGTQTLTLADAGTGTPAELAGLDLRGKLVLLDDDQTCALRADRVHNIRDSGAAGIVAFPSGDPGSCAGGPIIPERVVPTLADTSESIGIPYVSVTRGEAHALRAVLGTQTVRIRVTGTPDSPYSYQLALTEHGRIPDTLHYTLSPTQVARVDADYHAASPTRYDPGSVSYTMRQLFVTDTTLPQVTAPTSTVEYVGPLYSDVVHRRYVLPGSPSTPPVLAPFSMHVFDRPTRTHDVVDAAPVTPGGGRAADDSVYAVPTPDAPFGSENGVLICSFCRQNNTLFANFSQIQGRNHYDLGDFAVGGLTRLYRDGEEVPMTDVGGMPAFRLPPELGEYRLTLDDPPAGTTSEWTFRSEAATETTAAPGEVCLGVFLGVDAPCRPEPLVFVSYDLGDTLSMDNTVPAGQAHVFTVSAYHTPTRTAGPPITDLTLWTSTDDGAHWTPATVVRGDGGRFTAAAIYPDYAHTTGAVSLKVTARDADGNTVTQTTLRAFALRGRTPTTAR